jgi:hypothetical protein
MSMRGDVLPLQQLTIALVQALGLPETSLTEFRATISKENVEA